MQLYLMSASAPDRNSRSLYDECYDLWSKVWTQTLNDLDGTPRLYSDGFTRQEFLCAVEAQGVITSLCFFRTVDLTLKAHQDDSWLSPWPVQKINELADSYRFALIPSWLTVRPEYRKSAGFTQFNFSVIMSELISLLCLHLGVDIALGTPRKDRSVHSAVAQAGATCILPNVQHHSVPVDLVAFYPEKLRKVVFRHETFNLWKTRIDLRNKPQE
ncbi:MAG: hypothetical protein EOP04_30165, partial [Proteobacteria bacterium]